mmetsp:Transcript_2636/g.7921  ORF Transcript_2636/g.7921 Transcript_2636/m.7921 type:complete len:139 (+) Transcript_2636:136-552(+)
MSTRANELYRKMDEAMNMVETKVVMPEQKKAFLCCADCCDRDNQKSLVEIENCVAECQRPVRMLEEVINQRISQFSNSFAICAQACESDVRMSADNGNYAASQKAFDKCIEKCVEEGENRLPRFIDGLKVALEDASAW